MEIARLLDQFKDREAKLMNQNDYRWSSVLIPLIQVDSETHLLFEVRSMKLRSQPGDTCFPGGRMDASDKNAMDCAIRETSEELGIQKNDIDHIIPLDYIISDTGIIHPFAGRLKKDAAISINEEVAEVFTVPLRFFLENQPKKHKIHMRVEPEEDFPYDLIQNGRAYNWRVRDKEELFYIYEDRVIWGLTAKIIRHFVRLLQSNI